jgi:hypothetical protein
METTAGVANLERLMAITDLFARRLVADRESPAGVLLIERDGELQIVMLEGSERDVATKARRQLAQEHATSAALIVNARTPTDDRIEERWYVLGETEEGVASDRGYRVRPWGRRRRLTPLVATPMMEVSCLYRPLFAVHRTPHTGVEGTEEDGGGSDAAVPLLPSSFVAARTESNQRSSAAVLG